MTKRAARARWIWVADDLGAEDYALRARAVLTLRGKAHRARLRVAAFTDYVLYVNGRYVGRGPVPSELERPLADVYTEDDLPLRRGRNAVAVLAYNPHVGTTRAPRLPGGLWLDLEVTYKNGSTARLVTDTSWRLREALDLGRRSPRLYWTAGFSEVRDTRLAPKGWTKPDFKDADWAEADIVEPRVTEGTPTAPDPVESPVARLAEGPVLPVRVQSVGQTSPRSGMTAVPFEFTIRHRGVGEFYAGTFMHSATKRRVRLALECDEVAALYVNNRLAIRQGYDEEFAWWLTETEHDEYTGVHRGQGYRAEPVEVDLDAGWNSVGIVVYDPGWSWGFALHAEDAATGRPLKIVFSPDQLRDRIADWQIVTEELCPCGYGAVPEVPAPNPRTFPDPASLLAWQKRRRHRRAARGAASLLCEPGGEGPLALKDGAYVRYDFGDEVVGHFELEVRGKAGAILDLAWAEEVNAGGYLDSLERGMRRADRWVLAGRWQRICGLHRRALRYLELVARPGEGPIEVRRLAVRESHAPAPDAAGLEGLGADLSSTFALARRTARCTIQQILEGSPAREAEQSLVSAWILGKVERTLYGRTDRAAAALRAFAADQADDGAIRAIVPAGTRHTMPDWMLLWVVHLAEHVAWTGDRAIAEELWPAAQRVLDWTAAYRSVDGLLENVPDRRPWWLFVDLSPVEKTGEVTAWQALYVAALRAMARVAAFLGYDDEADAARAEAEEMTKLAGRRLWDAGRERFVDARQYEARSERASPATNAYALWAGLASDVQAEKLVELLTSEKTPPDWGPMENPFVKIFAVEALLERGRADDAARLVGAYFGAMAEAGFTTVPEVFRADGAEPQEVDGTGPYLQPPPRVACHGWGAWPEAILAAHLVGVHPVGPGFEPAVLRPMPGDLGRFAGSVWTPKGKVAVEVRPGKQGRTVTYTVPDGLEFEIDRQWLAAQDKVVVRE